MHQLLRPVWAEISLGNFKKNIETVRSLISGKTRIMAVVKANAYGIGAAQASKAALAVPGVVALAVATPEEALQLRDAGISCTILVLGPSTPEATEVLARRQVSVTVTSADGIKAAEKAGALISRKTLIHLKIETGMGRVGFRPGDELEEALRVIRKANHLEIEGMFTHFAAADTDKAYTIRQWEVFERSIEQVRATGIVPKYIHASNSAAIMDFPSSHLDLVRPGIMLYGCYPDPSLSTKATLYPVVSLYARISHIKRVPKGTYIGYGKTYQTQRETTIATLPIGYADGYPRLLSNKGSVLIRGKRYPIVGRVCMDQTMVDLGDDDAKIGERVTLIGTDANETISLDEIAQICQTISHEILTGLSPRVPRIYV